MCNIINFIEIPKSGLIWKTIMTQFQPLWSTGLSCWKSWKPLEHFWEITIRQYSTICNIVRPLPNTFQPPRMAFCYNIQQFLQTWGGQKKNPWEIGWVSKCFTKGKYFLDGKYFNFVCIWWTSAVLKKRVHVAIFDWEEGNLIFTVFMGLFIGLRKYRCFRKIHFQFLTN